MLKYIYKNTLYEKFCKACFVYRHFKFYGYALQRRRI